jgi:hypothetical protein
MQMAASYSAMAGDRNEISGGGGNVSVNIIGMA